MNRDNLSNLFAMIGPDDPSNSTTTTNAKAPKIGLIRVRIIGPSGHILVVRCKISMRLVELTNRVKFEFCKFPSELFVTMDPAKDYRLIRAHSEACELDEHRTLEQLKIVHNDVLLMLERRNSLSQYLKNIETNNGPTLEEIQNATRVMHTKCADKRIFRPQEIFLHVDLQFGERKILIPLAQASAAIIGAGPFAQPLISSIKQKLINRQNDERNSLECLIKMGYKKELAQYGLKLARGVYAKAIEWLRENDETPPEEQAATLDKNASEISISDITTDGNNAITNTEALLNIVRIHSQHELPPNKTALAQLLEMGFNKPEALNALKKTYNNVSDACEYLCGNTADCLTELHDGLALDSPVLKTILEMPKVQLRLGNPKVFLALLSRLAEEHTICRWIGDIDSSDIMNIILRAYENEKFKKSTV